MSASPVIPAKYRVVKLHDECYGFYSTDPEFGIEDPAEAIAALKQRHQMEGRVILAIVENNLDAVISGLNAVASVNFDNNQPLRMAVGLGHRAIADMLIQRGADIHLHDDALLAGFAINGDLPAVQMALDYGANLHANQDYPLQGAARSRQLEVVDLLLRRGAHANAVSREDVLTKDMGFLLVWLAPERRPTLSDAIRYRCYECVTELIRLGADIDADDKNALRLAIRQKDADMVSLLISLGASVEGVRVRQPLIASVIMAGRILHENVVPTKPVARPRARMAMTL